MMLLAALSICSVAAVTDIRSRRIPNWLTYSAMLLGVGYHVMVNGANGFLFSTAGLFLGLALLIVFYLAGGMGAGDVKLMGAVGALLGPKDVFTVFFFSAIVGGIYAIILLLVHFRVKETAMRLGGMLSGLRFGTGFAASSSEPNGKTVALNYGVAIATGVFLSVLWNRYGR
jgi:prepilin peptidase CpaA